MRAKFSALKQTHDVRLYVRNFVSISVYSVGLCRRKPQFLPFFGIRHFVVSPVGISLTKLNTGARPQTFPDPMASKLFLYSNAFMAKQGAQTLTFRSVTNKQTDRQTNKKLNVLAPRRRVKSEPQQTWHGNRGLQARSCTSKTVGIRRIVSSVGGAENVVETRPHQLKTHITP